MSAAAAARPIRVALADDSALFRGGLAQLLAAAGFDVVAAVRDGVELRQAVGAHRPDAVITDIRMPPTFRDEGISCALELHAEYPRVGILILSTYLQTADALRLLQPDAAGLGYLLKDRVDTVETLAEALNRLVAGESVVDPEIISDLLVANTGRPVDLLTEREREVLELMAQGRSNAGISSRLYLSPKTVERHIATIFGKLGLYSSQLDNRRVLAVLTHLDRSARSTLQ